MNKVKGQLYTEMYRLTKVGICINENSHFLCVYKNTNEITSVNNVCLFQDSRQRLPQQTAFCSNAGCPRLGKTWRGYPEKRHKTMRGMYVTCWVVQFFLNPIYNIKYQRVIFLKITLCAFEILKSLLVWLHIPI